MCTRTSKPPPETTHVPPVSIFRSAAEGDKVINSARQHVALAAVQCWKPGPRSEDCTVMLPHICPTVQCEAPQLQVGL
jgi:hypothetical protein